eukprot:gene8908-biopygen616
MAGGGGRQCTYTAPLAPPRTCSANYIGSAHGARSERSVQSHAASTMTKQEVSGLHQASFLSCAANLTNSIVGAGILRTHLPTLCASYRPPRHRKLDMCVYGV